MSILSVLSRRKFLFQSALAAASTPAFPLAAGHSAPRPLSQNTDGKAAAPPPAVTRIVADWVVRCDRSAVPENARKEAVRSIVNWIGVTIGGSKQDAVNSAVEAIAPYSGPAKARLFGRAETLDPLRAALIHGISSHVLDFDDTDLQTIIHPAGPIAGALFALSQDRTISGADFIHAFVLGVEVECRIGKAIYPSHYEMGWHITGTCGVFGAAAACGKILGLNAQQMRWALGIAATEAAGLKVMFGSMCKSLNVGHAAENGLLAAILAAKGFTSSDESLEGKDGYVDAASRQHNYSWLTDGLGEHYEITLNTYKPFACGIVIHPTIDALIQLHNQQSLRAQDVRTIAIRANPLVLQLTGKTEPKDGLEAKFSVYHSAAVALVRGYAGTKEYTDKIVRDPEIVALRRRVTVTTNPDIRSDEVFVTVTTVDGHIFEKHVEHAIGSLDNPLTNRDLEFKFRQLTNDILPEAQVDKLLPMAWNLTNLSDAGELLRWGSIQSASKQASLNM